MKRKLRRAACLLLALMCAGGPALGQEAAPAFFHPEAESAWYQAMLRDAQLSLGNNQRLKRVIERARAGETLTIAAIGGSITEGAGAAAYRECYAVRFAEGFRARYATGGSQQIRLINAGVGGTPSTFGLMRYERDILAHVEDADGLPDLVIVEFAVNDGGEPTGHQCYESLVKELLSLPNQPAVILLFAVFWGGWNLQDELRRVGDTYDLMMVSIRDAAYPHVGKEWTREGFFSDDYHPTSMGHSVMADCLLAAVDAAEAAEESPEDIRLDVPPAFGTGYMGLHRLFGDTDYPEYSLDRGSFSTDDRSSYATPRLGRICGPNFSHAPGGGTEPLTFTATFSRLLLAWRAVADTGAYGRIQVRVDGKVMRNLGGGPGKWGQSEVELIWSGQEAAEHTVEIRLLHSEDKRFTITCIAFAE